MIVCHIRVYCIHSRLSPPLCCSASPRFDSPLPSNMIQRNGDDRHHRQQGHFRSQYRQAVLVEQVHQRLL